MPPWNHISSHQNRLSSLIASLFLSTAEDNDVVELPKVNEDLRNFFLPRKHVAPEPEVEPEVRLVEACKLAANLADTDKGTQRHTGAQELQIQVLC